MPQHRVSRSHLGVPHHDLGFDGLLPCLFVIPCQLFPNERSETTRKH